MSKLIAYKKEIITGIGIGFLLYFLLKFLFPLFFPFLLAFITIYSLYPFLYKIEEKWKINKTITSVILLLFVIAILSFLLCIITYFAGENMGNLISGIGKLVNNIKLTIANTAFVLQDKFGMDGLALEEYLNYQLEHCMDSLKSQGCRV